MLSPQIPELSSPVKLQQMLFILLVAVCSCQEVLANPVREIDLYSVELPASSRGAQERAQLASKALRQVFVRCTGDAEAQQRYAQLRSYLGSANRHVSRYQYHLREDSGPETDSDESDALFVTLSFEPENVQRMLRDAAAPFWQAARPQVSIQLTDHSDYIDPIEREEKQQQLLEILGFHANQRGLPVRMELLESGEMSGEKFHSSLQEGWQLHGELMPTSSGYRVWWSMIEPATRSGRSKSSSLPPVVESSVNRALAAGVDAIADRLAQRFAVTTDASPFAGEQRLTIRNIRSKRDYLQLQLLLNSVKALANIQLLEVDGDELVYQLPAVGDPDKLRSLLTLTGQLNAEAGAAELVFYWQS